MRTFWSLLLIAALSGCGNEPPTPFSGEPITPLAPAAPTSTQPVENDEPALDQTAFCAPDAAGVYRSAPKLVAKSGKNPQGRFSAEGGGCIERPLADILAVMQTPAGVKWKKARVDKFDPGTDPLVDWLFTAVYKENIASWTIEWRQKVAQGDLVDPQLVHIRYNRTVGQFITFWEGGIDLQKLTPTVTGVTISNEIQGNFLAGINTSHAEGGLQDLFNNMKDVPTP
ncbi:hypothetical protein K2X33_16280 [bacterium]|nr:hypothetical protein [bacterium]